MKTTLSLTLLGACLLASPLAAGGLRRDLVPSDVQWVGHFDLEGFQRTQLWQQVIQHEEFDYEEMLVGIEEVRAELGIDPFQDIRSVTVWSSTGNEQDAVAMVHTTSAIDRALERFAAEDEYRVVVRDGFDFHSWDDEGFAHVHRGQGDDRMVLLGASPDALVASAQVLNGKALSLAGNTTPRVTAVPNSQSFAFFAASEGIPGIHEVEPASQIAMLAQGMVVDVGEASGEFFVRVNVQTADIDAALNLGDVFDGLVALGKLAMSSEDVPPALTDMVRALQIETQGNHVQIEFRYGVQALFEAFEELADENW